MPLYTEILHRAEQLPHHRYVSWPSFCSQSLVDLDSQSFGSSESLDVCRCTLAVHHRIVDLLLHCCVSRPSFYSQSLVGLTASPSGAHLAGIYAAVH